MKTILKNKLTSKNSLIGKPGYSKANSEADNVERKAFPKGYSKLKSDERTLGNTEVMGKVKSGRVEVERRFKKERKEIALHDEVEKRVMSRKKK